MKLSSIRFYGASSPRTMGNYYIYGSNDDLSYTYLISGTNSVAYDFTVNIPEGSRSYYKYYKIYSSISFNSSDYIQINEIYLNGVYMSI